MEISNALTDRPDRPDRGGGNSEGQRLIPMVMATGQGNAEVVSDGDPSLTRNHEAPIVFDPQQITSATNRSNPQPGAACHTLHRQEPPILVRMREGKEGGGKGPLVSKDQSLTLATANDQVLAVHEVVGSMCAESGPNTHGSRGVSGSQTLMSGYCQPTIGMQVRRLTPRECERLQGFPDDYTLVPWRGNMSADGPRYKALGNSWAVPVVRWIGERIELVQSVM